jgi:uncharacterized protein (DUF2126 family)
MSIHAALNHITHYKYDRLVALDPQIVRLRPAPHCRSKVLSYSMKVEPSEHFINWQQDPFSNYLGRLVFPKKTRELKVTIDLVVEMSVYNPFDFFLTPSAETYPFKYTPSEQVELAPYLLLEPLTPLFKDYLNCVDRKKKRTIDFLVGINQKLSNDIDYLIRLEPGVQTPEQTIKLGSGSCRDSAWMLVQLLRHCGLAARFVSGYLIQLKADVKALDGPSGTEVDFTDLHAWCEVFLPGAGWIGLDPTSGLLAGEGHIPLACTPLHSSAAPLEGSIEECEVEFSHHMAVTRIYESPRVTQPYDEATWQSILDLGQSVEQKLANSDVRLTMGGEPTFVATGDRDAPEWNTEALGPTKRGYATALVQKLRAQYGQGGFLHFGQGKWYPGEQLPRWALSIYWRADGHPIWHNPALFSNESSPKNYTSEHAKRFIDTLSENLGLSSQFITPGFEDVWYYLWRERKLPINVDPFDAKLDDEMERIRLRRVFSQKLDSVVGYVLPLQPGTYSPLHGTTWSTGPWFFRDERMYLVPGDSPMGYRLPLDSLPWVSQTDFPYHIEQDPFAPRSPLKRGTLIKRQSTVATYPPPPFTPSASPSSSSASPSPPTHSSPHGGHASAAVQDSTPHSQTSNAASPNQDPTRPPRHQESAHWLTRTALCVEARDPMRANGPQAEALHGAQSGVLYVFMPPLAYLEDYLELLAQVEKTASELHYEIVLEGYPPPRDPRLKLLQVTPDPGVIEVNIHPAHNWSEVVEHTEFLYRAAFECKLSAEKFMTDGKHTGTGGGNHVVLGAATPADSPFLRRPELLASLLKYWHNHPCLSYLFSGMFIGPTSQAPRVDEARNDQLYELEIALEQIKANRSIYGSHMPAWLVDRTLRNILVDVTGNTHRSEFCIDKLYSPDSSTGRLGLLELRAFEMPPHARMSIVQQLLIRALIARFWEQPYDAPITRWGTELHDRFLLPSMVWMDFKDVLTELQEAGFGFQASWFAPHFEFRFPLVGAINLNGIQLTLRNALEPWHVMGEEGSSAGSVRYVDSSLERIELHVSGLNQSRYTVCCNGAPLPLQPTGTVGEYVAGVRYKAWNPPSSLHPSIGVHAPLTFDLVDTWMKRSLGGCVYNVSHPGGRNYEGFPINAFEAESRRQSRFTITGHTPGTINPPKPTIHVAGSREFPFTLDLRQHSFEMN